jgi:hypothetical protein
MLPFYSPSLERVNSGKTGTDPVFCYWDAKLSTASQGGL